MNTVLVTGGLGTLGNALSTHLRLSGYDVIQSGRNVPEGQGFAHVDVSNFTQVCETIETFRPTVIVHLAATFENQFDSAFTINVMGAKNILTAIDKIGCVTRVVLAGSAAEYGLISPDENPIHENTMLRPVSIYGLTKSWQTNWGLMCAHQGQDVIIARIFNLDAPQLSNRLFIGRINQQIEEILLGKRSRIEIGSLSAIRDYVSLNLASQQLLAIIKYGQSGTVYHVASGQAVTMRDLLTQRLMSHNLKFDIVDEHPNHTTHTGYDIPIIYADITRTKALFSGIQNVSN
ncbi:GDP-mannose 4,6-dehydratase [soil metagenome]